MRNWTKEEVQLIKETYKNNTDKEIANKLNRTENAIRLERFKLGLKKRNFKRKWYFKGMSPELAYLIGVYFGDGCCSKNGKDAWHFRFKVTDLKFIENVREKINSIFGYKPEIHERPPSEWGKKKRYIIYVCSTDFAKWLVKVTKDKSTVPIHLLKTERERIEFLRGIYHSEGSIDNKRISLTNTNLILIKSVEELLKSLDMVGGHIYSHSNQRKKICYDFVIYKKEFREKFLRLIGSPNIIKGVDYGRNSREHKEKDCSQHKECGHQTLSGYYMGSLA